MRESPHAGPLPGGEGNKGREQRIGLLTLTRPLTEVRVPTTVQAVLAARIDRLAAHEKGVDRAAWPRLSTAAGQGILYLEVGQTFSRAFELCQQIEAMPELFQVILGLTDFYSMRLELSRAHELAQQLVAISERDGEADSLIEAHMTSGVVLLMRGSFALARDHLERAAALVSSAHRSIYGPAALCWHGAILGYLGYADQALDKSRAALALARELSDRFTYINGLHSAQIVHQLRKEWEASLDIVDDTLRLSMEHGFQQYSAFAMCYRGRALTQLNHAEDGVAELRQGIRAMQTSGMYLATLSYGPAGRRLR